MTNPTFPSPRTFDPFKMSAQEIFNTTAAHLKAQGEKSRNCNGLNSLRGLNGTMCAIGPFVDVADPATNISGISARKINSQLPEEYLALFSALQDVHDLYNPVAWPDRLHQIAADFGLQTFYLEELFA